MARVVHFEIPADDPARAKRFYTQVFGWKVEGWGGTDEYQLAQTGAPGEPGIDGAIMKRPGPGRSTNVTVSVTALDATVDKLVKAGGKVVSEKQPIPGVGLHCYCQDPEGNLIGLLQPDPAAK